MKYTPDEILEMIQVSGSLSPEDRVSIFEFFSQTFSVIPLLDGFEVPDKNLEGQIARDNNKSLKRPLEKNWSKWCFEKRPFDKLHFSFDRAGIACGPASGIIVLDIDHPDRYLEWMELNNIEKILPTTFTVKTGGEGDRFHYYFQYPDDGGRYPNRSVRKTFDIRSAGGQVLCPGSLHPETRQPYTVFYSAEIAEAPGWLLEFSQYPERFKKLPQDAKYCVSENTTSEDFQMDKISPFSQHDPTKVIASDSYIANLPVAESIKELIVSTTPKGSRSEVSMKVLVALVGNGVDAGTIRNIYNAYPIGEKAKEAGVQWLEREIGKAKEYAGLINTGGIMASSPSDKPRNSSPPVTYCVKSALEVTRSDKKFEFIIDRFWPKGEALLITGPGGAGKSIMTVQIAMDLVSIPSPAFLNTFAVLSNAHKVLFVQSENTSVSMKQRFDEIRSPQSGYSISDNLLNENLFFLGVNDDVRSIGNMLKQDFLDQIKSAIESKQADIIVLDPLISFHDQDENSNDQMRRLLDKVSLFCESLKVTPLLIHHHGKFSSDSGAGGGRGASAIGDWSPNTWELTYVKARKIFKFINKKARNFRLQDDLELTLDYLRFKPVGATAASLVADPDIDLTIRALRNLGGVASKQGELIKAVQALYSQEMSGTISDNTAKKKIEKAVQAGHVKLQDVPNGNKKKYTL